MKGDIKIVINHKVNISGNGGSENSPSPTEINPLDNYKGQKGYSIAKSIARSVVGNVSFRMSSITVLANAGKEAMDTFLTNSSSWSGDVSLDQLSSGIKYGIQLFAKSITNPVGVVKDFYRYNQQIASLNAQATFLANRSGNSALSNGSRGTNE